jgi:hypothetical protein
VRAADGFTLPPGRGRKEKRTPRACKLESSARPFDEFSRQSLTEVTLVTKPLRHDAIMPSISGGRSCPNGKRRRQQKIGGRSLASPRHCRASFHRLFYLARSAAHSCRRRPGSRSIRIGAHIYFALIAWRVRLLAAAKRLALRAGGSATTARSGYHPHSGRRQRLIGNAPTCWVRHIVR